jgi:nucleoside phosphorylase
MKREDYEVGWICALPTEYVAACELLDEEHNALPVDSIRDENVYTFGRMGNHNVVIACLPKGKYGVVSAATVAKDMLRSFEAIRFGLMVGLGSGAPSMKHDIRLGDVVVCSPAGNTLGVIQYDFGKAIQDKKFYNTGALNAPPRLLLNALSQLETLHFRKGNRINESIVKMIAKNERLKENYTRPKAEEDRLYESFYTHVRDGEDCANSCSSCTPPLVKRGVRRIDPDSPHVHYGLIASGNSLMKDANIRDRLIREYDILCFEMEAAGLMDSFPCVVIRGICAYSDTHKNDRWQGYASATAAAYAKELLDAIPGRLVEGSKLALDVVKGKSQYLLDD